MNKIVIVGGYLLGLALACIPAYANPINKKITLSCTSALALMLLAAMRRRSRCALRRLRHATERLSIAYPH